jgi:hypothetical protein
LTSPKDPLEAEANEQWKAESRCPQCGAHVELAPGDPVLSCAFCKTRLYIASTGPLRYIMPRGANAPPEAHPPEKIVHLPFWRFRGLRYQVMKKAKITSSLLDTTVAAVPGLVDDATLGIQPQVAKLCLIADNSRLAAPHKGAREALYIAERRFQGIQDETALFERFVGASNCLVYAPFTLMDSPEGNGYTLKGHTGTIGRVHHLNRSDADSLLRALEKTSPQNAIRFLPLLCPECGHDLPAEPGAVALFCSYCARSWRAKGGRFVQLPYSIVDVSPRGENTAFFPFWHLIVDVSGLPIKSRADLLLAAIPYRQPSTSWHHEAAQLLIPAFKLPPRLFLRVARNTSLASIHIPQDRLSLAPGTQTEPVRLPLEEAAQVAKVVLAHLLSNRRRLYPLVPRTRLRLKRTSLLLLPFASQGREWIDIHSSQAIPENAIELGRRI